MKVSINKAFNWIFTCSHYIDTFIAWLMLFITPHVTIALMGETLIAQHY